MKLSVDHTARNELPILVKQERQNGEEGDAVKSRLLGFGLLDEIPCAGGARMYVMVKRRVMRWREGCYDEGQDDTVKRRVMQWREGCCSAEKGAVLYTCCGVEKVYAV